LEAKVSLINVLHMMHGPSYMKQLWLATPGPVVAQSPSMSR